jgi:hypothetical protein
MVHQLVTVLPRVAGCLPSECRYLWVWELQERGALHWHGALELPDCDRAQITIARFKGIWCDLIDSVSSKSGVDLAERLEGGTHKGDYDVWRVDAQLARESPSQYLAKYLSKDASKVVGENFFFPTRWYGCSRSILAEMRSQTMHFETVRPVGLSHGVLADSDVDLLQILKEESSFSAFWKDRYADAYTFLFYMKESKMADVVSKISAASSSKPAPKPSPPKWKPTPGIVSPYVVWASIDRVLLWPVLSERLYLDIGIYYRAQLDLYRNGLPSVWGDMYWVDRHAKYLLYLQSDRSGVNSGSAPVGGLTPDASKTLGKEWGASQLSLLSGLPF